MITNGKLTNATAITGSVLSGKTFYAGDKSLKTGTIASKAGESKIITPSKSAQSYTFSTSGKYCTGNMVATVDAKPVHNICVRLELGSHTGYYDGTNFGWWAEGIVYVSVDGAAETSVIFLRVITGDHGSGSNSKTWSGTI